MSNNKEIIDVHCHLFSAKYLILESLAYAWNSLTGNYPHQKRSHEEDRVRRCFDTGSLEFKNFLAYLAKLIHVLVSDCNGNYDMVIKEFDNSSLGKDKSILLAPLMMDIYFALDDNEEDKGIEAFEYRKDVKIQEAFVIPNNQKEDFQRILEEVKKALQAELERLPSEADEKLIKRSTLSQQKLDHIFQEIKEEVCDVSLKSRRSFEKKYKNIETELSPGYQKHLEELEKMAQQYPNKMFPFLAVDPRRRGIVNLIEEKVGQDKSFKGIKIYNQLGYLPTHPGLVEVFDYCIAKDIPITAHCSRGGIINYRRKLFVSSWDPNEGSHYRDFEDSKAIHNYFSDPAKWLPVLERWKNLRINFAHFGSLSHEEDMQWANTIILMMIKYPNVYADLSYFSKPESIQKVDSMTQANGLLKRKLMFGTDFVMIMLDEDLMGLEHYFNNFDGKLAMDIMNENAKRFLKL